MQKALISGKIYGKIIITYFFSFVYTKKENKRKGTEKYGKLRNYYRLRLRPYGGTG